MDDLELNSITNFNNQYSVKVQNAYKRYSATNVVLNGLNMNVPDGCIYGLLGPSGSGKTTLLNCVVGKSTLDSGIISLKVHKLRDIGYMPQTLSLHTQMTIKENIIFYGYLFGMSYSELKDRMHEYVTFLQLPDEQRFVGELSEGQKRRVSLIITLIHDPEILILDEPTVGMDLIISDRIWKRLLEMAAKGKSIIITTHYIQEAQQAHKIGLMREGILLAEESPQEVMLKCSCDDLETAFLQLSKSQATSNYETQSYPQHREAISQHFKDDQIFSKQKIRGIFYKDVRLLKHGYTFLFFALLLPTVILLVFNMIVGRPPKHLVIGVINDESPLNDCNPNDIQVCFLNESTNLSYSCILTDILRNETYKVVEYQNEADAVRDFRKNKIYAVLHFPQNYTDALSRRFSKFMENLNPTVVEQSFLDLWVDTTNKYMNIFVTLDLTNAMLSFIRHTLENCHLNPKIVTPPIFLEDPIYGSMEEDFSSYTLIPFLFINSFIWPMTSIGVFFLAEKTGGTMDRVLLTGTSILDMMSSFFMIQLALQFISTLITIAVIFGILDYSMDGNMFLFTALLMIISISGMLFGLFSGMIHADVRGLGITLSCLSTMLVFFTGILRPLEEQHIVLKTIGTVLPITWSIKGLQAIRFKNKTLQSPVLEAFTYNLAFIAAVAAIILYLIKYRKIGCIRCSPTVDGQTTTFTLL